MKHCKNCPSVLSMKYGLDPEQYDTFTNKEFILGDSQYSEPFACFESLLKGKPHPCWGNKRQIEIAKMCHKRGIPLLYKLHPYFKEYEK